MWGGRWILPGVAKSFYKGERLGSRPPCAVCMGRGEGERGQLTLPGGVTVWLCAAHRSPAFQRRRAGRDFAFTLSCVWQAAGCFTARRRRALELHRERLLAPPRPPAARSRPGSYSWPQLRQEAEDLWARGQPLRRVIDRLRAKAARGLARPPSRTTLYRWHTEARWRAGPEAAVEAAA